MSNELAERLEARAAALANRWEARARAAHPVDAMLINLHIRELRELLTTPDQERTP